ncbi:MAG: hypothetical protein V1793_03185, partial [Pseudomonadota bacterium]
LDLITGNGPVIQHGMPTREVPIAYLDFVKDYINDYPEWFAGYCQRRGVSGPCAMDIVKGLGGAS